MVIRTELQTVVGIDHRARSHWFWCPACDQAHAIHTRLPETRSDYPGPLWDWDGNGTAPTFGPSIAADLGNGKRCHSYIKAGQWEFLSDSSHALAGKTVPMVSVPDWLAR